MHKPAKVYPPYRDGKKWRLVIVEAGIRKAVTVNTLEKAEALREELTRTLTTKGARSVGDVLAEWLDYKQEQGLTARSIEMLRYKPKDFLPLDAALS